jgi:hypothetical protein
MDIDTLYQQYAADPRPLPLIIAELWQFPLTHVEKVDGLLYAVHDWLKGVAELKDNKAAGNFWRSMKRRVLKHADIDLSTRCTQLPYQANDGKTYKMDYANAETLYYITQRMSAETGIRDKVLRYLAKAGVKLDEFRTDPGSAIEAGIKTYQQQGHNDEWIEARSQGILARAWFTAALQAALDNPQPLHFALASNEIYRGLWQRTAAQLKAELSLPKKANLRDHQPAFALIYQKLAEMVIAEKLGDKEFLTWGEAQEIIKTMAQFIGSQARATSELMGTDLATGKRLLGK